MLSLPRAASALSLRQAAARAVLALACALSLGGVAAQPALDAPPPLPHEPRAADAAREAVAPRKVIRLPADARVDDVGAAAPAELTEVPADRQLPPARITRPETQIDKRWQGHRVMEIIVTPARSTHSYVIVNREGQRPLWTGELSAGLSTPRLLRLDF